MPEQKLSSAAKWALIGSYVVALLALLYPLFWNPAWELGKGLALTFQSVPWGNGAVRTALMVTFLLTFCGSLGGLAYHIGRDGLLIPSSTRTPTGETKIRLGFIGDAFLGAMAANALHFPLAAMVPYKNLTIEGEATQSWLVLGALGVLGGYAGGILLKRWSDSLVATMAKEIEENKKLVSQALGENEHLRQQQRKDEDAILFRALDEAGATHKELDTTAVTLLKKRSEAVAETEKQQGLAAVTAVDAVFAAYHAFNARDYKRAAQLLEYALQSNLDPERAWRAENLLGLSYHYQDSTISDWFSKAERIYKRALARGAGEVPSSILQVNLGFLYSDHADLDKAVSAFDVVRQKRTALRDNIKIADVASLGAAVAHTRKFLAGSEVDKTSYQDALQEIEQPEALRYLFRDGSVPDDVKNQWKADTIIPHPIRDLC